MWILAIDDNPDILEILQHGLKEEGHTVDIANNGLSGEILATSRDYDIVLLDIGLPGKSGISLVKSIRSAGVTTPVLLLSGLTDVEFRVKGLDAGADDYLAKPFSFEELMARIRALRRRAAGGNYQSDTLSVGLFCRDVRKQTVIYDGTRTVPLRLKELALFDLLAQRKETVVTRTVLAERVWGAVLGVSDDVINMTVSSLRKKLKEAQLENPDQRVDIQTIRGVGYLLTVSGE